MTSTPSSPVHKLHSESITVECCRACSFRYDFRLPNHQIVTVLCGRPIDVPYKAVSYLWEDTSKWLPLVCLKCSHIKAIPMRDSTKLWGILNFVRGGSKIWLDAMSIDQDDPKDLATQLMHMGDIYQRAQCVSVFLPREDSEAFEIVKDLAVTSDTILRSWNTETLSSNNENFAALADQYLKVFERWTEGVNGWKYWSRAWTFQEWSMAAEIEIMYERSDNNEGAKNIKEVIVSASSIICQSQMRLAKSKDGESKSLTSQLEAREETGRYLNLVRAHFPFVDFPISSSDEDPKELRGTTLGYPLRDIDSGTYVALGERSNSPNLLSMLSLSQSSIGISKREASKKADLVACWASMCNIAYDYDPEDSFAVALHKVVTTLRRQGLPIYNFIANSYGGETDLKFMEYATTHRHSNSRSGGHLFGPPIFTGRADTVTHFRHLLHGTAEFAALDFHFDVKLQLIDKVSIKRPVSLADKSALLASFKSLVSGRADGARVVDVMDPLAKILDGTRSEQLEKFIFVPVSIAVEDISTIPHFNTWAICPSSTVLANLAVARESLNGTLVLATLQPPFPAIEMQIVSYLNMTSQSSGTYLVKSDDKGVVDIVFRTSDTPFPDLLLTPPPVEMDIGFDMSSLLQSLDEHVFNVKISFQKEDYGVQIGRLGINIGLRKKMYAAATSSSTTRIPAEDFRVPGSWN
jgi:hypothetical protein